MLAPTYIPQRAPAKSDELVGHNIQAPLVPHAERVPQTGVAPGSC